MTMEKQIKYLQHPLSAAFPAMAQDEFDSLVESIGNIGVQNAITIFEGMVIDGWHRYRATLESGMFCPVIELADDVDPRDFVLAQNKSRRNLTASQRAAAVTAVYQWHPSHRLVKSAPGADLIKTSKELAAIAGVGVRTIEQAKSVQSSAVQTVKDAVKSGAISVKSAAAVAKLPVDEQKAIAAGGPESMKSVALRSDLLLDYTPLDAANDRIDDLQVALAMASMGDVPDSQKSMSKDLIYELRAEVKTLTATLDAVNLSRDSLMQEVAQLKKQCQMQRKEIEKLKTSK